MASSTAEAEHHASQSKKAAASGWIGSALEYYDFFIYATAAALVFPQIFFPSENPTVAIVASLATYGVGYVARPIGAFFLGHWGDTHGRKTVLILCMFLMGISTMLVGLLPTYAQAGIWAPILLVVLRLVQGFAVAGEISGASSMILEHAPFGRRGFYASFTLQGVQAGQILAAAVFLPLAAYMPTEAFNSWGWRIPFLLSFFVIVAGYIIRREVDETPAFAEENQHGTVPKAPIIQAFKLSWRDMIRVVCMALMNVIPVVATIFGAAYAVQPAYGIGFSKDVYLWIPVLGNMLAVLVIPIVGNLSDKVGRKPPIIIGALLSGLLAFGYLYAISIHSVPLAIAMSLLDVGCRLPGLQRDLPELLSGTVCDANPGVGDGDLPEYRDHHHRAASGPVCNRCASRLGQYPRHRRRDCLRHYGDRGTCRHLRQGNLPAQHQRSRQSQRGPDEQGGIRAEARGSREARSVRAHRRAIFETLPVIVIAGQQGSRSLTGLPKGAAASPTSWISEVMRHDPRSRIPSTRPRHSSAGVYTRVQDQRAALPAHPALVPAKLAVGSDRSGLFTRRTRSAR